MHETGGGMERPSLRRVQSGGGESIRSAVTVAQAHGIWASCFCLPIGPAFRATVNEAEQANSRSAGQVQ